MNPQRRPRPVSADSLSAKLESHESKLPDTKWFVAGLILIPTLMVLAKQPWSPLSAWMRGHFAFEDVTRDVRSELRTIVFVPFAALLVVVARVSLGIRVLGPFRSILLATAFLATGIPHGAAYLAVAMCLFLGLRPLIKALKLPYFGRATMMLCCVAGTMTLGALSAQWFQIEAFNLIVYFPIVVLSLVADAFARVAAKEGLTSAIGRCVATASLAALMAWLMNNKPLRVTLLAYPELILAEMAGIIAVCRWMPWRLLDRFRRDAAANSGVSDDVDEDDEEETKMVAITIPARIPPQVASLV